jgi:hypothetical protein
MARSRCQRDDTVEWGVAMLSSVLGISPDVTPTNSGRWLAPIFGGASARRRRPR